MVISCKQNTPSSAFCRNKGPTMTIETCESVNRDVEHSENVFLTTVWDTRPVTYTGQSARPKRKKRRRRRRNAPAANHRAICDRSQASEWRENKMLFKGWKREARFFDRLHVNGNISWIFMFISHVSAANWDKSERIRRFVHALNNKQRQLRFVTTPRGPRPQKKETTELGSARTLRQTHCQLCR